MPIKRPNKGTFSTAFVFKKAVKFLFSISNSNQTDFQQFAMNLREQMHHILGDPILQPLLDRSNDTTLLHTFVSALIRRFSISVLFLPRSSGTRKKYA
jgi:hypothetical protein